MCRRESYSGGALLDLGHVAGIESSSELLAAVWPAFLGAGASRSVPDGVCLDGSLAWPPPEADMATIETQLRQRLSEGAVTDYRPTTVVQYHKHYKTIG